MSIAASRVISDQTELRLLEQSPRRTDILMHKWGCRNGTVGELVQILEGLQWFRPRDIILECMHDCFCFFLIVFCHLLASVVSTTSDALTSQIIGWVLWLLRNSLHRLYLCTLLSRNSQRFTFKLWRTNKHNAVKCDISLLWSHRERKKENADRFVIMTNLIANEIEIKPSIHYICFRFSKKN